MMLRLLSVIVERQGNGQNAAPSGGGGGGGGFGGGGFFLFAPLSAGHGLGLVVLLVLVGGYFAFSYFSRGRGLSGLFSGASSGGGDSYDAGSVPAPIPPAYP